MERELVKALGNDSHPVFSKQDLRVTVRKGLSEAHEGRRDLTGGWGVGKWISLAHCWAFTYRLDPESSAEP